MIAIGYIDLKYLPPLYLKTPENRIGIFKVN